MSWPLLLLIFFAFIGVLKLAERVDKWLGNDDLPRQPGENWDDDWWMF